MTVAEFTTSVATEATKRAIVGAAVASAAGADGKTVVTCSYTVGTVLSGVRVVQTEYLSGNATRDAAQIDKMLVEFTTNADRVISAINVGALGR